MLDSRSCLFLGLLFAIVVGCSSAPPLSDYDRGVSLQQRGDLSGAILAFRSARDRDPQDEDALYNLGWCLMAKADGLDEGTERAQARREAEAAFGSLLERRPNHARALVNLAALVDETGRSGEARELLERARDQDPGLASVHSALGAWHLRRANEAAEPAQQQEALVAARDCLEDALQREADHPASWYLLGRCCERLKDAAGARRAFQELLARVPDDQAALLRLADLAFAQEDAEEGFSRLRQLLYIDPAHEGALALLERSAARGGAEADTALELLRLQEGRIRSETARSRWAEARARCENATVEKGR